MLLPLVDEGLAACEECARAVSVASGSRQFSLLAAGSTSVSELYSVALLKPSSVVLSLALRSTAGIGALIWLLSVGQAASVPPGDAGLCSVGKSADDCCLLTVDVAVVTSAASRAVAASAMFGVEALRAAAKA